MRNLALLVGTGLILAAFGLATDASAGVVRIAITGPVNDTFTLNDSAGIIDAVPGYLAFNLISDSNGFNGAYFGGSVHSGDIGAGYFVSSNLIAEAYDVFPSGSPFYSGSGTSIHFTPGSYGLTNGGSLVVSDVPEPASVLLMLTGLVGLARLGKRSA